MLGFWFWALGPTRHLPEKKQMIGDAVDGDYSGGRTLGGRGISSSAVKLTAIGVLGIGPGLVGRLRGMLVMSLYLRMSSVLAMCISGG